MPTPEEMSQLFKGFSKLDRQERYQRLQAMGALTQEDIKFLTQGSLPNTELAENLIENVIGYFPMPLGVATNLCIDGIDRVIPMAVEETSIIAAVSKTARWIRQSGRIDTEILGQANIGQIQIAKVNDFEKLEQSLTVNKDYLIHLANQEPAASLCKRGGGVMDIYLRRLARQDGHAMAVIHILVNTCDAMGANLINQICEFLKGPIENITQETVTMCILSNLNDHKLTRAKVTLNDVDPKLGQAIEAASLFAEQDPYRAATHNKGVLNGIDPILIATGNDWRAVEAGIHAHACKHGHYQAITQWRYNNRQLCGLIEVPLIVGTVGGMTKLHPTAQLCLRMLGVQSADELSRIIAAVGLVQNLGALQALTTVGIIQGHMKLHISNLTLSAGAKGAEIPLLKKRLEEILALSKRVTLSNAIDILNELRKKTAEPQLATE